MKITAKVVGITAALVIASAISLSAFNLFQKKTKADKDKDGHTLIELWKSYNEAAKADLPTKELETLDRIISQSSHEHLPWDFYDAWQKYRSTAVALNWKDRNKTDSLMKESIIGFDEPIVSFYYRLSGFTPGDSLSCFIRTEAQRLKKSKYKEFYNNEHNTSQYSTLPKPVINNISNDYEHTLWIATLQEGVTGPSSKLLKEYLNESYPSGAYLEYLEATGLRNKTEKAAALLQFEEKYSGKAISLYARQDRMTDRFLNISSSHSATSEDFIALRDECKAIIECIGKYKGREKDLLNGCNQADKTLKSLESKNIVISGNNDTLRVLFRNLDNAVLTLSEESQKKSIFTKELTNLKRRYYIYDTLEVTLPQLNDGDYTITCTSGDIHTTSHYTQRSVSVASRIQGGKPAVYAAESISGKPLSKADFNIYLRDSLIRQFSNISLNGFTTLDFTPERNSRYYLQCTYTDSAGFYHSSYDTILPRIHECGEYTEGQHYTSYCKILKDRSVFIPGDTIRFKTVSYTESETETGFKTTASNKKLSAYLVAPKGERVDSTILTCNRFGSSYGEFILNRERLNGLYFIEIYDNSTFVASEALTIGHIDLPTFELIFDDNDSLLFPGSKITVKGIVNHYSGHRASSLNLKWCVKKGNRIIASGNTIVDDEDRFSINFKDRNTSDSEFSTYIVQVTATDSTGETREFTKYVTTAPHFFLDGTLVNDAKGDISISDQPLSQSDVWHDYTMMNGDSATLKYIVRNAGYDVLDYPEVKYSVFYGKSNRAILKGTAVSSHEFNIDFSGKPSGMYRIEASFKADMKLNSGKDSSLVRKHILNILRISDNDTSIDVGLENFFKVIDSDDITLQLGTTAGNTWAILEIWGKDTSSPLASDMIFLEGNKGMPGSVRTLKYKYEQDYPEKVRMKIFYFRNNRSYSFNHEFERKCSKSVTPLNFSSFTDTTRPFSTVSMSVSGLPFAEYAISVYDKGTEQVMPNTWSPISKNFLLPWINYSFQCGERHISRPIHVRGGGERYYAADRNMALNDNVTTEDSAEDTKQHTSTITPKTDLQIREQHDCNTLAFIPFISTAEDGIANFNFQTSGKISTFIISAFGHDSLMRNGAIKSEFTVTKPVIVSVAKPHYLYESDRYALNASVSNNSTETVHGILNVFIYDGSDYHDTTPSIVMNRPISINAGTSISEVFESEVLQGTDTLGYKVIFNALDSDSDAIGEWSDGIFFTIPVYPDEQTLTEAHSMVMLADMNIDSVKTVLSDMFVNTPASGAEMTRIKIADMLREAIPARIIPKGEDVISLSEALFSRVISGCTGGIDEANLLADRIFSCQNADGGFGWFSGMKSSPEVTATVLERIAEMMSLSHYAGLSSDAVQKAVKYIDRVIFDCEEGKFIPGHISIEQYLYLRVMFPSVSLELPDNKIIVNKFRKTVASYLSSESGADIFNDRLISKARRDAVVMILSEALYGKNARQAICDLASAFGMKRSLLKKSLSALHEDIRSILSHCISHPSGGVYFPNAVMPFSGILESELYAHSLICDILQDYSEWNGSIEAAEAADKIRIWMMVQKETQLWNNDPAFVRAIASVLKGSDSVKNTDVVVLKKSYSSAFHDIKASGNGMKISRKLYRNSHNGLQEISSNEFLNVGEKVICRYIIHSSENRCFVMLTSPREAALRPIHQVSGITGAWYRHRHTSYNSPIGYRDVRDDKTIWYFDVLPEEESVIEEEYHVTQAGCFSCPIPEIVCLYAPHHRANDNFFKKIIAE